MVIFPGKYISTSFIRKSYCNSQLLDAYSYRLVFCFGTLFKNLPALKMIKHFFDMLNNCHADRKTSLSTCANFNYICNCYLILLWMMPFIIWMRFMKKKKLIISSYCPDVQNLSQNLYYLLLLFFFLIFRRLNFHRILLEPRL